MKTIIGVLMCLFILKASNAQDSLKNSQTKIEIFQSQRSKLFQKEFTEIGKVRTTMTVQILEITDLTTNDKIKGLVIEWFGSYTSFRGFFDVDEVDDLLKSVSRMTTFALSPPPKNYTEIVFQSKSDFQIGIYPNNNNKTIWRAAIKDLDFPTSSILSINSDDLSRLQALLVVAKDKLK